MSSKMKKNLKKLAWTAAAVLVAKFTWNLVDGDVQTEKVKQQIQG